MQILSDSGFQKAEVSEDEYKETDKFVDAVKAMYSTSYKGMYIRDYNQMNFLYISDNIIDACEDSVENIKEIGFKYYEEKLPPEDYNLG